MSLDISKWEPLFIERMSSSPFAHLQVSDNVPWQLKTNFLPISFAPTI